jgi:hypothetical protein
MSKAQKPKPSKNKNYREFFEPLFILQGIDFDEKTIKNIDKLSAWKKYKK